MKMSPSEAFETSKTAITQIENLTRKINVMMRNKEPLSAEADKLYNEALTAFVNMGSMAECVIRNCNRAEQMISESENKNQQ